MADTTQEAGHCDVDHGLGDVDVLREVTGRAPRAAVYARGRSMAYGLGKTLAAILLAAHAAQIT